nr:creatininase family protein [Clostridia bacterium]
MRLENLYPDIIEDAIKRNVPLFIPVGTMEYHSAHMPLGTDTQVAYHILEELEKRREIIIAPPVWYGCASYAVKGPEGYSIDMDGKVLNDTMYNIYMSLLKSGYRRVITVLA